MCDLQSFSLYGKCQTNLIVKIETACKHSNLSGIEQDFELFGLPCLITANLREFVDESVNDFFNSYFKKLFIFIMKN